MERYSTRRSCGYGAFFAPKNTKEKKMSINDLVVLIIASLKDDLQAIIKRESNVLTVMFPDGSDRIILVE